MYPAIFLGTPFDVGVDPLFSLFAVQNVAAHCGKVYYSD